MKKAKFIWTILAILLIFYSIFSFSIMLCVDVLSLVSLSTEYSMPQYSILYSILFLGILIFIFIKNMKLRFKSGIIFLMLHSYLIVLTQILSLFFRDHYAGPLVWMPVMWVDFPFLIPAMILSGIICDILSITFVEFNSFTVIFLFIFGMIWFFYLPTVIAKVITKRKINNTITTSSS